MQEPEGDDLTGLPAIAQCARRGRPFQRVAYIRGMAAAARQAPFSESVMVLAPLLHELAGDPSDEIRADTALQLAPIGEQGAAVPKVPTCPPLRLHVLALQADFRWHSLMSRVPR